MDAIMGIVGSIVVSVWACGLLRDTGGILLDRTPESSDLPDEIRRAVESDGDSRVTDLHIWQIAAGKFAAIISIVAHNARSAEEYRERVQEHEELVHVPLIVRLPEAKILDGSARDQVIQALRMAQIPFREEIPF